MGNYMSKYTWSNYLTDLFYDMVMLNADDVSNDEFIVKTTMHYLITEVYISQ